MRGIFCLMNKINKITKKKKSIKLIPKIIVNHILGIIILMAFTYIAVLYSKGSFELPFYDRNQESKVKIEFEIPDREPGNSVAAEESTEEILSLAHIINPDMLIDKNNDDQEETQTNDSSDSSTETTSADSSFDIYSEDMKNSGYAVTDGIYESYDEVKVNTEITRYKNEIAKIMNENEIGDSQFFPPAPILYEYKFAEIKPEYKIPETERVMVEFNNYKRSVEPFMDYIIIRDGPSVILCDASGKIISPEFESTGFEILKMRDDQNRTVFTKDSSYYIYDPNEKENESGGFISINFDPTLGNRGVNFMYPSYYGANGANNLDRFYAAPTRWGWLISGVFSQKIWTNYTKTFNFSENIGIAYKFETGTGNRLHFLNETGKALLDSPYYYAPDAETTTKDHLGYFYFDHGLTRAELRKMDYTSITLIEKEVILEHKINSKGDSYFTEFYIPEDYNIKAYSNGIILLEKDGYYGFMNYLGEWIVQPIYTYAQPFYEGIAVIGLENGKKAIIDTKGSLLVKFKYSIITDCTGGIIAMYEKGVGWTILNKVRKIVDIE